MALIKHSMISGLRLINLDGEPTLALAANVAHLRAWLEIIKEAIA